MRLLLSLSLVMLGAGCSAPSQADAGPADAGSVPDASIEPPDCVRAKDCTALGFDVCRSGKCAAQVLCVDDAECALGERCVEGHCSFTGCSVDADCATGRCRTEVFACAQCGSNADCPATRPVCDASNQCVQCGSDSQCAPPGPAHCDVPSGGCVHCLEDKHCPNGLSCGAGHVCTGAPAGAACPMGVTCGSGLVCVGLGGLNTCLPGCSVSNPTCAAGQICFKLTFSGGSGLVFDQGGPLGVCYSPQAGLKGYREACTRPLSTESASNCQPNLACIPDSPSVSLCRTFCDLSSASCPSGEMCHPFSGDFSGRLYGLCYPDNGWGARCDQDGTCKSPEVCAPYEDPAASGKLTNVCQFPVGAAPGLSPCKDSALTDGGVLKADRLCRSGSCQADPLAPSLKSYCYAACKLDADCAIAGRTGSCDGDFVFPLTGTTGTVRGCRPACTSTARCAEYGTNVVCRARFTAGYNPTYKGTCAPPSGALPAGAACSTSPQCRSGFCLFDDGRGVRRVGTCAEPCDSAADCAADGGTTRTGPLSCGPVTFTGFRGFDGVAGTHDDQLLTARLCGGGACAEDADCGTDAGVRCVPDVDPADAGKSLVLRCRPPHATAVLPGTSACTSDADCASGVCGALQPPSTGSGRACFQACTATTVCPGASVCRAGGMRVSTISGEQPFDACAP